ncbi:MAG: hypothetical protein GU348_00700 [Thermogladius sp.]|jgi:hypothetical protein|nr:hypothetical protein [Thermogladius sp.]
MSYMPRGIHPRVFNNMIRDLRGRGLWAERHSYSMRVMYEGRFVASLHFYPGYNIVEARLYAESPQLNEMLRGLINGVIAQYLPEYRVDVKVIR